MRSFNSRQKRALYIRSGGRCEICNEIFNGEWDAHHVVPYSQGGETKMHNAQALCRSCHVNVHRSISKQEAQWD